MNDFRLYFSQNDFQVLFIISLVVYKGGFGLRILPENIDIKLKSVVCLHRPEKNHAY